MKAYGFPIVDYGNNNVYGNCFSEDGTYLGGWTSSNLSFLEHDLSNHAKNYDYKFVMVVPDFLKEAVQKHHDKTQVS